MHQFNLLVRNNLLSNNQMVQTRSGEGQGVPPVIRAHIANRQNQAPPPPPPLFNQIDPAMQQLFAAQTQLLQKLTWHCPEPTISTEPTSTPSSTSATAEGKA
jgi:hypothetical protein